MSGLNARKIQTKSSGPQQEAIEPGSYPARVVRILDLGVQKQRPYKGEEKSPKHMIELTYELVDEFCLNEAGEPDESKPRWVSEEFSLNSLDSDLATSTKRYNVLDPKEAFGGDFTQLIGCTCMVTVVQNPGSGKNADKIYNNVANIAAMRPRDAAQAPELVNPSKVFVLDEPDMEVFLSLPQWIQDKIKGNLNFGGSALQQALEGGSVAQKPVAKAKPKVAKQDAPEEPVEPEEGPEDENW